MNAKICLQNSETYNLIYELNWNSDSSSIVIGIGGVGIKNLDEVKSRLRYERQKQVQFLAIDTDRYQLKQQYSGLNMAKESFYIEGFNVGAELVNLQSGGSLSRVDWLNPNVSKFAPCLHEGTSGIRQVGKYLLSKKVPELYSKLRELVDYACAQCPVGSSLDVYILTGLGGGTGSGCFVDVCYLVRELLEHQDRKTKLEGYLFLPDMFESYPYFQRAQSQLHHMRINSYAAVKEINYLMDIPENKDSYSQRYHCGKQVQERVAPFDKCYLIHTKQRDGYDVLNICKRAYFMHQEVGVHLFEGEGKNWRELPDLMLEGRPEGK